MAITATGNFGANVVLPTGYTNPTLPTISTAADSGTYSVDLLATAANVDPEVGALNVLTALEADFEGAQATRLHLNAAATVTAAVTITAIKRMNDGDDTSQFKSGTEQYRCNVSYTYE
jgi:hypothetical protein